MSNSEESKTESLVPKAFRWPWLVLWTVIVFWIVFFISTIGVLNDLKFAYPPSMNLEQLNYFGGSFNVIASLFTSLAFAGLVVSTIIQQKALKVQNEVLSAQKETLKVQQQELKSQNDELRLQRQTLQLQYEELSASREQFEGQRKALQNQEFDNKFFQMLQLLDNVTDNLILSDGIRGRKVFDKLIVDWIVELDNRYFQDVAKNEVKTQKYEYFKEGYNNFNRDKDVTFKYYFINLFQILKYIDLHKQQIDAKEYTNIVRAQLTKNQLILLAYNCIGVQSFTTNTYQSLVEKYAFFEHLKLSDFIDSNEDVMEIITDVLLKYDPQAFGSSNFVKDLQENIDSK